MKLSFPCKTTEGETVMIVEKAVAEGDKPLATTLLTSEDGRTFRRSPSGLTIVEVKDAADLLDALPEPAGEDEALASLADDADAEATADLEAGETEQL